MNKQATLSALFCALLLGALQWGFPVSAMAHRVTVFAWVEGDAVVVTGKFSGGKKVRGGRVLVHDQADHLLLEGRTDEHGEFTFTPPQRTGLKIILDAGAGHRGEWILDAAAFSGADVAASNPGSAPAVPAAAPQATGDSGTNAKVLTEDALRTIVEEALDKRLAPIERRIDRSLAPQEGPRLPEILGGIGYIIGLVGLGAYINSRKKSGEKT